MTIEIERKFLVRDDSWNTGLTGTIFKQAYLNSDPERTVRIRVTDKQAFITIKSKTRNISRHEFEYNIPTAEAEVLLKLCETPALEKKRYLIKHEGHQWEIDEFFGSNEGLVIAEIELKSDDECFAKPQWLGKEVSDDVRYFNSQLTLNPFCLW